MPDEPLPEAIAALPKAPEPPPPLEPALPAPVDPAPPPDRYRQWMGEPEKEAEQSRARQATAQQPKFQSTGQPTPGDVAGHLLRGDGGMHHRHHGGFT